MLRCPNCGEENPERARFCLSCGTALAAAHGGVGEVRKTVSVLFADVVSSTSHAEQTDPESTRRALARYFEAMRRVVERHGGTVEKFIGDAVMAVFGIPVLHEDDALRAVRAASDMRSAIASLNADLAGSAWPPISLRIGVNTGEVVAGDPSVSQTLVTGDAVNVAARLEQAAGPDEIILGLATHRLVREAVDAEPMAPLELKGKATPVEAVRLVALREGPPVGRRHDTPLVGRRRELRLLAQAFESAVEEPACYLFTLLGPAGVGKSRLVHEFLGQLGERARILGARCLPYGEGITFWPITELVQGIAGIGAGDSPEVARRRLEALVAGSPERQAITERVAATIGLSSEVVPTVESFWGVRKLLEWIAREQPLLVVIDDLHWAEPTLLDLIDHVTDWSREAPILLLAVARPELLDERPQWGGGKLNATTLLLEPLNVQDAGELVTNLVGDRDVAAAVLERIGDTAEGNPLFVEELVSMLVEEGALRRVEGGWRTADRLERVHVPPTISALVAARLDHLEPSERDLIGRASVVGKVFQRSAVTELSPPERRDELPRRLMTLVRKELVRPDQSAAVGDEAFRFRHILVRDAAYAALPKEQRADLHARFADWLERVSADRLVEVEEVVGYHLEQAHAYRVQLGKTDEVTRALGARAAEHLGVAGKRAMGRRDVPAWENLLSRALALTGDDRQQFGLLIDLARAAFERGDIATYAARGEAARAVTRRLGDEMLALELEVNRLDAEAMLDPGSDVDRLMELTRDLERAAIARGDAEAEATALMARSGVHLMYCRWMEVVRTIEKAMPLVDRADDPSRWMDMRGRLANALRYGPVPAAEAIGRIEAVQTITGSRGMRLGSPLLAMQGRFDEANALLEENRTYLQERGLRMRLGAFPLNSSVVRELAGDAAGAEAELAEGIAILEEIGETGVLSTLAAMRARLLRQLGRPDEMREMIELARRTGAPNDIATQADWRTAAAWYAADQGRLAEAQQLIAEADAFVQPTDFLELRARVYEAAAHVQARAGDLDGWRAGLERALAEHERKGNLVGAATVRELLAGEPPPAVVVA
jgi:class 3 adenylate cyclase